MAPTKKNSASVRRQARKHGEHVLAEIEALSIRMGGGKEVSFDIAAELSIPDDLNQLRKTGQTAPARMAFWSYQAERAAAALRRAQDELDEAEGTAYLAVREHFADQGESIQDKKVRCVAAQQTYVIDAREKVRELEEHHGIIKSLMFATAERSYMIRRMLKTEEFEMEEGR